MALPEPLEWRLLVYRTLTEADRYREKAATLQQQLIDSNKRVFWNPETGQLAHGLPSKTASVLLKAAARDTILGWRRKEYLVTPELLKNALLSGVLSQSRPRYAVTLPADATKTANALAGNDTFYMPTIPVDAFNQAVWSDVARPQNPYGTRSTFGDNRQPMTTPPWAAAAAAGVVAGTGAVTGQSHVSPWQVAQMAAAGAGTGYLRATLFAKTIGALSGMPPSRQADLQRMGLWSGLVTGAVQGLFGGANR